MFVFWILFPHLVCLCCPVCQGDSTALIMSEERRPLSPDITAVKPLSTQTNLHHVSDILSPHTHSCYPGNMLQQNTESEQTIGESVLENTMCKQTG